MIFWIMLVVGLISLVVSIYSFKWHDDCNKELDRDAKRVNYGEYLISGLGAYLLPPASFFIIISSILCLCEQI